jgi:hypothetical protein
MSASALRKKAMSLGRKDASAQVKAPKDEMDWYRSRARAQGLDIKH